MRVSSELMRSMSEDENFQIVMQTGDTKTISHFEEIISLKIQRENVASLFGSLPVTVSMNGIYCLS